MLERGECATAGDVLHVDCTAAGLSPGPARPVFGPGRIVLQQVRHLSPSFNAGLVAFLEAHRDDDEDRNRLCPPNPYPSGVEDWPGMVSTTWQAEASWTQEADLMAWVGATRLNLLRALPDHLGEPQAQAAVQRYVAHVGPAIERLGQLV